MNPYRGGDSDDSDEDKLVNSDPLGAEGVPYPKELLKPEMSSREHRLEGLKKEKKEKMRRNSFSDESKKRVSSLIRDSMIEGRKVWTEQEIVDRDMAETIGRFKERRSR